MNKLKKTMMVTGMLVVLLGISRNLWLLELVWAKPFPHSDPSIEYEERKSQLQNQAAQLFTDDPLRNIETNLDKRPFSDLNELDCPKVVDNSEGWSVIARTGGRPFLNFDDIELNSTPWPFIPCTPGASGIPQSELDDHYAAGKGVNRFWFTHKASNGHPIIVTIAADGFFNIGGAKPPMLMGAAVRVGFIGEPFGDDDYLQHVDEINIIEVDNDTLIVIYNIHSEVGEGILEVELKWNSSTEQPELHFHSAHFSRLDAKLGFAGLNFMRGPTLSGLLSENGTPQAGIEAFHDGRSVFLVEPDGKVTRNLLVPPILTTTIVREDISADVSLGSQLVMDQPQNVENYFSKHPGVPYQHRTDLRLQLDSSTTSPISLRRAQTAVDLTDINPEANETVNVFYAVDMTTNQLYEFTYTLTVAAEDFEEQYYARQQGVIFASDRFEGQTKLYFLPVDNSLAPIGSAIPLTDGVIKDPRRPSVSANGRFIIFDADDYNVSAKQRVYILDLARATLRRITVDPFGASEDWGPGLNSEASKFTMITSRQGSQSRLNIQDVDTGLGSGFGHAVTFASSADWSHTRNEIVLAKSDGLWIYNVETETEELIVSGSDFRNPEFGPCFQTPAKIAYATAMGIFVVSRDGSDNHQVLPDGDNPTWVDEARLIVQRSLGGNTDLYLVDIRTSNSIRLTDSSAVDIEPAWVGSDYCLYLPIIINDAKIE